MRKRPFGPLNQCEHLRMRWHCWHMGYPCGHLECPDCGFHYDIACEPYDRGCDHPRWMLRL
jgi:hypothetical protein